MLTISEFFHFIHEIRQRPAFEPVALLSAVLAVLIILFNFFEGYVAEQSVESSPERNFKQNPFDLNDASSVCKASTQKAYGRQYLRSYLDELSSEYDFKSDLYKVVIIADIGDLITYEQIWINCTINPNDYNSIS